jgi:Tfp pilus assembly protein PilV
MMRTFSARLRVLGRSSIGGRSHTRARACEVLGATHRSLAAEAGDTLLEVLVSALLLGLIVVGTFSGLNSTNRATSLDRARSQADALAEQNEEQLRAEPIKKLYELESHPRTENVTEGKTTYTIETTARYIEDATATASCTSSSAKEANYLQTTSKVTSPLIGAGKSVEETSIISPPAGSSLVVQVTEAGAPIQGAEVVATGPAPATTTHELETSVNGCAILALPPGEYNIDASKSGYVDPNGYKHTNEDSSGSVTHSVYIPAENTSKVGYNLGLAGTLEVKFEAKLTKGSAATPTEGDSFVAFNTGMTKPRPFPIPFTPGIYSTTVTSPATIFPFKSSKYTIYAGTCEADLPSTNGVPLVEAEEQEVAPGSTTKTKVRLGPVNIKVWGGFSSSNKGKEIGGAAGYTNDTGCNVKRTFTTNLSIPVGAMPHPGLPFGKYTMCVGSSTNRWEGTFENNSVNGPTTAGVLTPPNNGGYEEPVLGGPKYGIIYLGIEGSGTPPTGLHSPGTC